MSEDTEQLEKKMRPQTGVVRLASRWVLIILVLLAGVFGFSFLSQHGPVADKQATPKALPIVRVMTAEPGDFQHQVKTQGRVEPLRSTQAAAEIMGRVIRVSDKFRTGGIFQQNEVMLEVDSADYVASLASAEARHADAQLLLEQEQARAEQGRRDWAKLGKGTASELVLRVPQIKSARAGVKAASAAVEKARRDLERTKLRAPYNCRVRQTYTDIGSYVTPGARLADLYSQDDYELRLPVTMEELGYLRGGNSGLIGSVVNVGSEIAGEKRKWHGVITRTEGMVDRNTMSAHVITKIMPNKDAGSYIYPPAGMMVKAEISGRKISGVIEIPRSAIREDNSVLTMNAENRLRIVPVKIARTMEETVLIASGLPRGAQVIVSPIEMAVDGMKVAIERSVDNSSKNP